MAINLGSLFQQSSGSTGSLTLGAGTNTVFDLLDPRNARNAINKLLPGAAGAATKSVPNIGFQSAGANGTATAAPEDDWRVRVSLATGSNIFYQDPTILSNAIMYPLVETNGVIFPYTPTISVSHVANYATAYLTHSNYPAHFYNNSEVADITVSGEFTVQNAGDGQYLMAAVYFFRSATKMFFGQGENVGNPPPIVFLDGYGSHYFPHVPCVITNFTHNLPADVDYVQVPVTTTTVKTVDVAAQEGYTQDYKDAQGNITGTTTFYGRPAGKEEQSSSITTTTRVPTNSTISITLRPMYSRSNLHNNFNLDQFAKGLLLGDKQNGTGGFI